jgi:hypothetical protein
LDIGIAGSEKPSSTRAEYMLSAAPKAESLGGGGGGAAAGGATSVVVQAERATETTPKVDAPRNARRLRRSEKSGLSDMIPPVCGPTRRRSIAHSGCFENLIGARRPGGMFRWRIDLIR